MRVSKDLSSGEWELRITEIRHSDGGNYECQINTNPLQSHTITLSVVGKSSLFFIHEPLTLTSSEPYTEILRDSPEVMYIDIQSVLNLTCVVFSPEVPTAIFWKHNGKVSINYIM